MRRYRSAAVQGFHGIGRVGSRLRRLRGHSVDDVWQLMTHTDATTAAIHLDYGKDGTPDEAFLSVEAPFGLFELL